MLISPTGFIDYDAPGGEEWRIDSGREMLADFDIAGPDDEVLQQVIRWHEALSSQPALWSIVCRLFAVTPQVGVEDPALFRPWRFEEIAANLGMTLRDVEAGFAEAKGFWKKWQTAAKPAARPAPAEGAPVLDAARMEKLLLQHGFIAVDDEREREYIAQRIQDLESLLDNEIQRSMARAMIAQEASLFFTIDPALRHIQADLKERSEKGQITKEMEERTARMLAARNAAQSQLEATMKALNLSEAQTGSVQKKGAFKDSLCALIEAVAAYEAQGDRTLVDGIFTAAEIEVLTEPFHSRDFQYRPDLAMIVPECIDNLFDPSYAPPRLGRKAHRRLVAGFKQGLLLLRAGDGEVTQELDPESLEDRNEAVIQQAERDGDAAAMTSGMSAAAARISPPVRPLPDPRKERLADY